MILKKSRKAYIIVLASINVHKYSGALFSLIPRPFEGGGKAWGLLHAHARKIPFIFRIIRRKISDNDVIVHGESARPRGKSMRTHLYTQYSIVTAMPLSDSSRRICFHLL